MEEELNTDIDLISGIATGFGGGLGRRGLVCGALSGGVMVIGLKYGCSLDKDCRETVYGLTLELCRRFEEQFGTTSCYKLIGYDLTAEEERTEFKSLRLKEEKCVNYVGTVVDILTELLDEDPGGDEK
jgi:C_GCAxxG_C_C family probable redox protein